MIHILLSALIGCSMLSYKDHSALDPYVKKFEMYWGKKVKVPVRFSKLKSPTVGICYGFKQPEFLRFIEIDHEYWKESSEYVREALVFHELGHCVLNRDHDDSYLADMTYFRPKSLMHSYVLKEYPMDRAYYINELFGGVPFSRELRLSYPDSY